MIIDASKVRADESNAVVEYLCKSVEDSMLFEEHPTSPVLAAVENETTAWVAGELAHLNVTFLEAMTVGNFMAKAADDPRDECLQLEREVAGAPPGSLPLETYLRIIDCFMRRYLPTPLLENVARRNAIREYVAGRFKDTVPGIGRDAARDAVRELPDTIKRARTEFGITPEDIARINVAAENGTRLITDMKNATRSRLKKVVLDAERRRIVAGGGHYAGPPLVQAIADEFGTLNRDWRRIAVSETAMNAADGFIASRLPGKRVKWLAHPGACVYCVSMNGKVFTVVLATAPHKDPDTEIWPGKQLMNIGRSISKNKRMDDGTLAPRTDEELVKPAIPAHPHCRCNWVPFVALTEAQTRALELAGVKL